MTNDQDIDLIRLVTVLELLTAAAEIIEESRICTHSPRCPAVYQGDKTIAQRWNRRRRRVLDNIYALQRASES